MNATPLRHSLLAYRQLRRALSRRAPAEGWVRALHWVQWAPPEQAGDAWLTLGLDPGLSPADWPRRLRAGRAGEAVRLRCVPAPAPATAQADVRLNHREHDVGPGTLGALLQPHLSAAGAGPLALTAGHVLAGSGLARAFDPVDFHIDGRVVSSGRLHRWAPAFDDDGRNTALDAGVVRIDTDTASLLQTHLPLPAGVGDPAPGQRLQLLARGARHPARVVGRLSSPVRAGFDGELLFHLDDGLVYQVDGGTLPGDSGAAVWDLQDRLVAIHTGAMPEGALGNAIATPIRRVLGWFGAGLLTRGGSAQPLPTAEPRLRELPAPGSLTAPAREPNTAADVLARTLWGEARGEGQAGMTAVAHVVFNRRDAQRWWGRSVEAVCHKPFQFSCWNDGDPNRGPLLRVKASTNAEFAAALRIAEQLLALPVPERVRLDTTGGATHYHASALSPLPNWARGQQPCQRIGRHVFYRGIA